MRKVAALVLAAGRSSRFGKGPTKLVVRYNGKSLIRHVVDAAAASVASPVVVVTGHARNEVERELFEAPVAFVHNEDYASGLASSLRLGVASLPAVEGVVICLGDMPRVSYSTINRLAASFERSGGPDAVIPTCRGRRGNPVLIARSLFGPIATLMGDQGARLLLERPGRRIVEEAVGDPGVLIDFDTEQAMQDFSF